MTIFFTEWLKNKLTDDVLRFLSRWPDDRTRQDWKHGASVSFLKTWLKEEGWTNLPSINSDFIDLIENLGFEIIPGKLLNGKNHPGVHVVSL